MFIILLFRIIIILKNIRSLVGYWNWLRCLGFVLMGWEGKVSCLVFYIKLNGYVEGKII